MLEFGTLIREARERTHKSALNVALAVDMTPSMLSDFERGKKANPPSPDMLTALADELGISKLRMLRALGYLSEESEREGITAVSDPTERDILNVVSQLPADRKRQVLDFAGFMLRTTFPDRVSLPEAPDPYLVVGEPPATERKRKAG